MFMKKNVINILIALFFVSLFFANLLAADNRSDETERFISMLNSGFRIERVKAAKLITRSGLTDQKLFDLIQDKLLAGYQENTGSSKHIDEMSWFCKALASSGNHTYIDTLRKIASTTSSSKLRKYANQSIGLVEKYHIDNEIIGNTKNLEKGMSLEAARVKNMLTSDKLYLQKNAAKMLVRREVTDPSLYALVNEELKKRFMMHGAGKEQIDTMSWFCKALGASGNKEYRQTLEEVKKRAPNEKLQNFARKSLILLQ